MAVVAPFGDEVVTLFRDICEGSKVATRQKDVCARHGQPETSVTARFQRADLPSIKSLLDNLRLVRLVATMAAAPKGGRCRAYYDLQFEPPHVHRFAKRLTGLRASQMLERGDAAHWLTWYCDTFLTAHAATWAGFRPFSGTRPAKVAA